jgi:hypothetical protein
MHSAKVFDAVDTLQIQQIALGNRLASIIY